MVLTFNLSLVSEMGEQYTSSLCLMNSTNHIILFIIHVFPSIYIYSVLGKKFYSVLSVCSYNHEVSRGEPGVKYRYNFCVVSCERGVCTWVRGIP